MTGGGELYVQSDKARQLTSPVNKSEIREVHLLHSIVTRVIRTSMPTKSMALFCLRDHLTILKH
jgi:hypothetical protein